MSLVNELIKGLLPEEEKKQTTAVYAGGFKPPTSGHFEVVKQALKENPEIDEFIIFVGAKERNGISQTESLLIWEIYNNYLPFKVKIEPTSIPPIKAVYDFAKNHPTREVLWVIGAREGNEEDFKDITSRTSSISKYPNLELRTIVTAGGVSGTAARNAAKVSQEKFEKFLPGMLNPEERTEVYNIVADKITENKSSLEYLNSITKEAPFNPPQYLYHLSAPENIDSILKTGLKPGKPEASLHGGIMKGEGFSGVWLTPIDDVDEIVDTHFLPEEFYNGEILQIDTSGLNKDKFSIGIEYNLMKPPFTKQEYLDKTEEIIYLDAIPPSAISILQEIQTPAKERDVDSKELEMGIKVEMEHTDDPAKAKVIALQHLAEDPKYYTKLASLGLEEKTLTEAIDSSKFNFSPYIVSLTKHMLDNGMKLEPLPKVQMIHDDYENGEDLFGNTAYYNPGNNSVILFTYGRHPKDILRSYAHELVHVHQNMEDRLTGLGANTDVNQDDHLEQIEREAYETGNIMFRSWTDSITGNKLEENLNNPNLTKQLKNYIEDYTDININLLKDLLKIKNKYPKQLDPRVGGNKFGYRGTTFDKDFINKLKIKSKSNGVTEYEVPTNLKINSRGKRGFLSFSTDEEVAKGFGHYSGYVDYKKFPNRVGGYVKISLDNPNFIIHPNYMGELSKDMEYSKDNEKETLYVGNSFTPESIFVVDKDIYDTLTEGKKKDPFGLLAYAQELGRLREEENEYKVYLDMDGVLADFDQRFRDISGMEPKEFENKYGTKAFWNLIDEENKIKFWVGIPAMPGAADLVNAVKDYNYELLTSPSAKKQSYLGKILWVKNHTGDVFPSKPRINFKKAKEKHLVKPQLAKTDILIDDREDTIGRWNAAGGTGIVYKNISQVLNDLGKLGL
jgi:hypothetical protein